MRFRASFPSLAAALLPLMAVACSDAMVYGERTSFDLAIGVNEAIALPVSVNAGFHRTAAGLIPPRGGAGEDAGGTAAPEGEAVSMISGFRLEHEDDPAAALGGKLTIKTQFASGAAAIDVSKEPRIAARIAQLQPLGAVDPEVSQRQRKAAELLRRMKAEKPDQVMRMAAARGKSAATPEQAYRNLSREIASSDAQGMESIERDLARFF